MLADDVSMAEEVTEHREVDGPVTLVGDPAESSAPLVTSTLNESIDAQPVALTTQASEQPNAEEPAASVIPLSWYEVTIQAEQEEAAQALSASPTPDVPHAWYDPTQAPVAVISVHVPVSQDPLRRPYVAEPLPKGPRNIERETMEREHPRKGN